MHVKLLLVVLLLSSGSLQAGIISAGTTLPLSLSYTGTNGTAANSFAFSAVSDTLLTFTFGFGAGVTSSFGVIPECFNPVQCTSYVSANFSLRSANNALVYNAGALFTLYCLSSGVCNLFPSFFPSLIFERQALIPAGNYMAQLFIRSYTEHEGTPATNLLSVGVSPVTGQIFIDAPEPSTYALLLSGLVLVALRNRSHRKS